MIKNVLYKEKESHHTLYCDTPIKKFFEKHAILEHNVWDMSMILCEGRRPAVNTLYNLLQNLNLTYDLYQEYDRNEVVNRSLISLIERGDKILNKRILGCYRRLD